MNDRRSALLLVALIVAAFFDVLFLGRGFYRGDLFVYHFPMKKVVRDLTFLEGLPHWNPAYHGGQPLAANPAYELFYPPQWLVLLPSFEYGFQLHIVVHFAIAAIGMYLLLRSLEVSTHASLVGAVAFAFGAPFLSLLARLPFLFAMSWVPWVVLFARRAIRGGGARDVALGAIAFGMQMLLGEPVTVAQTGAFVAGYAIYAAMRDRRALLRAAIMTAGALLIAAVQLVPAMDHARDSVRAEGFSWKEAGNWATPPARLAELAYPRIYRALTSPSGAEAIRRMYPMRSQPFIGEIYLGLLIVIPAIAGLFHDRRRWWVLSIVALSLLFAFGAKTAVLPMLHDAGLTRSIRYPEKFLLTAIFTLLVWGAMQFDRLTRDPALRRTAIVLTVIWLLGGVLVWTNAAVNDAAPPVREWKGLPWDRYWWMNLARGIAALGIFAAARRGTGWWRGAAIAVALADVSFMHRAEARRAPREYFEEPVAARGITGRSDYRLFHKASWDEFDLDRTALAHFLNATDTDRVLRDAMSRFVPAAFGFRGVLEQDLDQTALLTSAAWQRAADDVRRRTGTWHPYFLESANVRWVAEFQPPGSEPPVAIRDIGAHPRYWFASRLHGDPLADHLVTSETRPGDAFVEAPFVTATGRVLGVDERPSRVRIEIEAAGRSMLVAGITSHRYWRATLDGAPQPIVPVNLAFQGIVVPAGRHVVELEYRNPLIPPLLAVSTLALAAAIVTAALGVRTVSP